MCNAHKLYDIYFTSCSTVCTYDDCAFCHSVRVGIQTKCEHTASWSGIEQVKQQHVCNSDNICRCICKHFSTRCGCSIGVEQSDNTSVIRKGLNG